MKRYKNILLDVDDTLLDFEAAETYALKEVLQKFNIEMTEELRQTYRKINIQLWEEYEKMNITKETVLNTRFEKLFSTMGKNVKGEEIEKEFRDKLGESSIMIKDAYEICEELHKISNLYIISNGVTETQINRLQKSGLNKFMKKIFISEQVGYQKPRIEFFEQIIKEVPELNYTNTLIVGDSLTSDMKLGENAGIDTCWFNPNKKENKSNVKITYEIQELRELLNIIK